jgi:hypothetical protein
MYKYAQLYACHELFRFYLYLGLFWSEELIGNGENWIHSYFYDATVSKMAANKIDKLFMVSDFNENWYLGVFIPRPECTSWDGDPPSCEV